MKDDDESFAKMVEDALFDLEDLELRQQQVPEPEPKGLWSGLTERAGEAKERAGRFVSRQVLARLAAANSFLDRDVPFDAARAFLRRRLAAMAPRRRVRAIGWALRDAVRADRMALLLLFLPAMKRLTVDARRRAKRAFGLLDGALFDDTLPLHVAPPPPSPPPPPRAVELPPNLESPTWVKPARKRGLSERDVNVPRSPSKALGPPLW